MAFPWFNHNWTIDFSWSNEYRTIEIAPPLPSDYSPTSLLAQATFDKVLVKDNQSDIVSTYLYAGYKSTTGGIVPGRRQKFTESGSDNSDWSSAGIALRGEDRGTLLPRLYVVTVPSSFIQGINDDPNTTQTSIGNMDFYCEFYLMRTRGSKAIITNYLKQDGTTEQLSKKWLYVEHTLTTPTAIQCQLEWEGGTISSDSNRHRLKIYNPQIQFTGIFHSSGASFNRTP